MGVTDPLTQPAETCRFKDVVTLWARERLLLQQAMPLPKSWAA